MSLTGVTVAGGPARSDYGRGARAPLGRPDGVGEAHFWTESSERDATVAAIAIEHLDKGRCAAFAGTKVVLVNPGAFGPGLVRTEIAEFHAAGFDLLAWPAITGSAQDAKPLSRPQPRARAGSRSRSPTPRSAPAA